MKLYGSELHISVDKPFSQISFLSDSKGPDCDSNVRVKRSTKERAVQWKGKRNPREGLYSTITAHLDTQRGQIGVTREGRESLALADLGSWMEHAGWMGAVACGSAGGALRRTRRCPFAS